MPASCWAASDHGAELGARFDQVREAVLVSPRNREALKAEIIAMREKLRGARPVKADRFDVKHSPGGMVDAEFAVQFLVLSSSGEHPELIPNVGNIALLLRAELTPGCCLRRRGPQRGARLTASCAACSIARA